MKASVMKRLLVCVSLLASVLVVGCGPAGPKLVSVKGKVMLDGKPLAGKTLLFVPDAATGGMGAGGTTKADGSYELIAVVPGSVKDHLGCPKGTYKVTVNEPMFPIEMDIPVQGQSDQADVAVGLPAANEKKTGPAIPSVYTSEATTTLTATVPEAGGEVNLELKSS